MMKAYHENAGIRPEQVGYDFGTIKIIIRMITDWALLEVYTCFHSECNYYSSVDGSLSVFSFANSGLCTPRGCLPLNDQDTP